MASQEAIKMLGINGGGIFNANSAHPFETLALDLRYHDTREHDFGKLYDSRAAATLKAVF